MARAASTGAPVLLLGETGAGKGAAARALHEASVRRRGPLVVANCAAIPETLAESTLFGHRAGAFTGATTNADGLFAAADRGTLLLDEVGDLPAALQPKLLQALEAGEVLPVGASRPRRVDVRFVAATNVDLEAAVGRGAFRSDLYAWLASVVLTTPPLRERREDVLSLLCAALEQARPPLTADLAEALVLHRWPYNVRELQQLARALPALGGDAPRWHLTLVADRLRLPEPEPGRARPGDRRTGPPSRDALVVLLDRHGGVVARVAAELGRSPRQVYRWLERHRIDPDDHRA